MLPMLRADLNGVVARRQRFEAESRALSDAQIRFRPSEGSWSIAEVAQHLLHVEREVTRAAAKPGVERRGRRRTTKEWLGYAVFLGVVHLNGRIKVPQKVAGRVTPSANPDMDELWAEWSGVHADLGRYLESMQPQNLSEMAFRHPIMGPTAVRDMLPFFRKHFDHHMRQVKRIRRARRFPPA